MIFDQNNSFIKFIKNPKYIKITLMPVIILKCLLTNSVFY